MSENILLRDKMIFSMFRSEHLNLRERTMNNHTYLILFILLQFASRVLSAFRVSDAGGKMQFSKVKSGAVGKADLKTQV